MRTSGVQQSDSVTYIHIHVWKWKSLSCVRLFADGMDCRVPGVLQARILEWVAVPFSRGSSQPRDRTQVSRIAGGFFTSWATREALWVKNLFKPLCHRLSIDHNEGAALLHTKPQPRSRSSTNGLHVCIYSILYNSVIYIYSFHYGL